MLIRKFTYQCVSGAVHRGCKYLELLHQSIPHVDGVLILEVVWPTVRPEIKNGVIAQ